MCALRHVLCVALPCAGLVRGMGVCCVHSFMFARAVWNPQTRGVCSIQPGWRTVRSAGVTTVADACARHATSGGTMPHSMTAWIWSLLPSDRYESVQHASTSISTSRVCLESRRCATLCHRHRGGLGQSLVVSEGHSLVVSGGTKGAVGYPMLYQKKRVPCNQAKQTAARGADEGGVGVPAVRG